MDLLHYHIEYAGTPAPWRSTQAYPDQPRALAIAARMSLMPTEQRPLSPPYAGYTISPPCFCGTAEVRS